MSRRVGAPKPAPTGRREIKPTGAYHYFRLAIERAGAVEFCGPCYCYVLPGHARHCRTVERAIRPTLAVLSGGLDGQAPMETVELLGPPRPVGA